jgi:tRNA pseudouridine55 synthase
MPPRASRPVGVVLVDKPAGPSSFALVADLRRRTAAKTGHTGTLDPFATGLLVLLSGMATKLAPCFSGLDKRYVTDIDLTATSSTGDSEGEILERHTAPTRAELDGRLEPIRGEVELPIPAASAVKIGGERAYRLARKGIAVEMPLRRSHVYALDVISYTGDADSSDSVSAETRLGGAVASGSVTPGGPDPGVVSRGDSGVGGSGAEADVGGQRSVSSVRLGLHVSSGTYVRAIATALGGHCTTLRRTTVGPFAVDEVDPERLMPVSEALSRLTDEACERVPQGVRAQVLAFEAEAEPTAVRLPPSRARELGVSENAHEGGSPGAAGPATGPASAEPG